MKDDRGVVVNPEPCGAVAVRGDPGMLVRDDSDKLRVKPHHRSGIPSTGYHPEGVTGQCQVHHLLTPEGLSGDVGGSVVAHLSRGDALIDVLVVGQRIHSFSIGRSLGFLPQALDLLACAKRSEAVDFAKLGALLDPVLARLSALIVITESEQLSRSLLVDHVERRGVVCRVLRLVDDRTLAWTRGNAPLSLRAASPRERVVTVGSIEDERPLSL